MTVVEQTEISDDFRRLTKRLDAELREKNGDAQDQFDGFNGLEAIHDVILVYDEQTPVGCAAFKRRSDRVAEVKRVFVAPESRGRGISRLLMQRLEHRALTSGIRTLWLETSRTFAPAVSLYQSLGFQVRDNFPPYVGIELSLCFQKDLEGVSS